MYPGKYTDPALLVELPIVVGVMLFVILTADVMDPSLTPLINSLNEVPLLEMATCVHAYNGTVPDEVTMFDPPVVM